MAKKQFRYLVRPDGTIRVVSQSVVPPQETDTLIRLTEYYRPGRYFWDFNIEKMVSYTDEQLEARRRAKEAEQAEREADLASKKKRLGQVLHSLSPDQREAVQLIAEIANVDLSS